ncbi:unnamed protein product [Protopolystoma xenopodis]|uniref:PTB domain-containing protein n=1 Tax=Protopolystoma xenopodis TaxID=117903 RepID=A0A3S5A686_9PLAT|nr:unnamed protein product [Protopolystoma xenopodis]
MGSIDVEGMMGPTAVQFAIDTLFRLANSVVRPTEVNFRVSSEGITMTDVYRRVFFRRHYTTSSLVYFGMDPKKRM